MHTLSYFPNYVVESLIFFTSLFYGLYLVLKNKTSGDNNAVSTFFFFNYTIINLFYFFLVFSSSIITYTSCQVGSPFGFFNLGTFLGFSFLNLLVFFIFLRSTKFKRYLSNIQFLGAIYFFLFFTFFLCLSYNALDSVVLLEFCTISTLLYVVSSTTTVSSNGGASVLSLGTNVKFNSVSFLVVSFLNFFFFMFIFGVMFFFFFVFFIFFMFIFVFFFFFFVFFIFYFLCVFKYESIATILPLLNIEVYFIFIFLFILFIKLAGAPFHFWKFEVFNNLGYFQIFYYSVFYIFFFFYILIFFVYSFNFNFFFKAPTVLQIILLFNFFFIILNASTVLDIRHFIILSTLINSSFFLLSIFLAKGVSYSYFFLFFLNYLLTSAGVLSYLYYQGRDFKSISSLRKTENFFTFNFFFFIPMLSLSGVAPTLGFLIKFFFLINVWSLNFLFLNIFIVVSIIFSTVLYFQAFKNFFYTRNSGVRVFFFKKTSATDIPNSTLVFTSVCFSLFMLLIWVFLYSLLFEFYVFNF